MPATTGGPVEAWPTVQVALRVLGAAFVAFGLFGWWGRTVDGLYRTDLGSIVPWGLWVSLYIFCIGASAGSFLVSSLVYVFRLRRFESVARLSLVTALVTLVMAMLASLPDIGHMERFWHIFAYPNLTSVMAWIPHLYGLYFTVLLAELWFASRRDLAVLAGGDGLRGRVAKTLTLGSTGTDPLRDARDARAVRMLAITGIPVAVLFHGGMGTLFGVIASRPSWNSALFPPLFLVSALASGGALVLAVAAVYRDGWRRDRGTIVALGRLVLGLFLADLLLQASEILIYGFPGHVPATGAALASMLHGPHAWIFWGWQLGLGTLVPLVLLISRTRHDARWVGAAGLLVAIGFLGTRLSIVVPELSEEQLAGLSTAISTPRLQASYAPSLTEWSVTAGILGVGILVLGFAGRRAVTANPATAADPPTS